MLKRWFLVGVMLLLASSLVVGCGIPQEEYDAVLAERDAAQAEVESLKSDLATVEGNLATAEGDLATVQSQISSLQSDLTAVQKELAEIKEVYPARHFNTIQELQGWLTANDVSDRPMATTAEATYSKALEIQQDALEDGYIVSAWIDYYPDEESFYLNCTAVAGGVVWMWNPETDEPVNFSDLTGLLKLS